ncbi:MAG: T9SS type A sorting domain-containing protein [Cytophagaceae bacterium]|nr:T9SS type A sorting domain-containing protein [Cytophagaceae bacterium]
MKRTRTHFYISRQVAVLVILVLLTFTGLHAQTVSGTWDAANTNGTTGYNNYGSGVIRLLDDNSTGCAGAAVHETSVKYDPTSGPVFSKCYKLFFGCPGNDNIGSDANGDGMAFSFSKCAYNINAGACGGGLGYHGGCPQMITIEFDTWSSQCNSGFDCSYGGGTSGINDEVAIHKNGDASDAGRITSANAGNLEDGLEHVVCISYDPASDIYSVTIDGNTVLTYDATGTGNELETYFGAGGLNQTWSSGKFGATNPTTVADNSATNISAVVGGPLCPAGVEITAPSSGTSFGGCPVGPISITATATPPAGNTVTFVEFFVDGVSIGTDNTATGSYGYGLTWNVPTNGNHAITAVAYYSGGSTSTSSASNISVGGGIQLTSTAPTIDGTSEAMWSSYTTYNLDQGFNSPPDLDGTYKVMYDNTNLYMLIDVTDDDLRNESVNDWEDDGIEVYIDIGNKKMGSYQANDFQFGFKYNDAAPAEYKQGATGGVTMAQGAKAGGYIMEVRIPWATLGAGAPVAGTFIGFDVKLNDDDGGGTRDHELGWKDGTFGAWNNPSLFGAQQFLNCNPLPVSLLAFTGEMVNETVFLNWITASEINNEKFIIERSTDLSDWRAIGAVSGSGNTASVSHYNFTDDAPSEGIVYYRLQQIDFDGTYMYSNVVAVETNAHHVSISPNPFDEVFTIHTNIKGEMNISIYDALGRLVYHVNSKSENGVVNVQPDLASGAYLVTVQSEAFLEQQKIIKK